MEHDPSEKPNYDEVVHFDDSDEDETGEDGLVEVSDETVKLLTKKCTQSVPNGVRRRTRSRYPLPKVHATKTPQLDPFMKSEISAGIKSGDKDLARIQTFVLDAFAPLSTLLEKGDAMSSQETMNAVVTAVELLGNANARISRIRREKVITGVNKALLPLVKEDASFTDSAPLLFGPEFAKRSKDYMDQVKAMRSTLPTRSHDSSRKSFFRSVPPNSRGGYTNRTGRGGAPNKFKGSRDRHQTPRNRGQEHKN